MKYIDKIICRLSPLHILMVFYRDILLGYKVYSSIKRKYGDIDTYVQYYAGTGDVYLSMSYLKHCLDYDLLKHDQRAVLVINGKNSYKVTQLLQLTNIIILECKEKEAYSFVDLVRFMGDSLIDISFLHYMSDWPMYTCFWIHLAGFHGINFWDLYQIGVFQNNKILLSELD